MAERKVILHNASAVDFEVSVRQDTLFTNIKLDTGLCSL